MLATRTVVFLAWFSFIATEAVASQVTSFSGWTITSTPGTTSGDVDANCADWGNVSGAMDPVFGFGLRLQAESRVNESIGGFSTASITSTGTATITVGARPALISIDCALVNGELSLEAAPGSADVAGNVVIIGGGGTGSGFISHTAPNTTISPAGVVCPARVICLPAGGMYSVMADLTTTASVSADGPVYVDEAVSDFKSITPTGISGFEVLLSVVPSTGPLPSATYCNANVAGLADNGGTMLPAPGFGPVLGDPAEPFGLALDCSNAAVPSVYRIDIRAGLVPGGVPTGFGTLCLAGPLLAKLTGGHTINVVTTPAIPLPCDAAIAGLAYTSQGWCGSAPKGFLSNALRETIGIP